MEKRVPLGFTTGFGGVTNEMVEAFSATTILSFFAGTTSDSSAIVTFLVLLLADLLLRTDDKMEGFRGNLALCEVCAGLLDTTVAWAIGTEAEAAVSK